MWKEEENYLNIMAGVNHDRQRCAWVSAVQAKSNYNSKQASSLPVSQSTQAEFGRCEDYMLTD
jgi:hypothetical protein